MEGIQGKVAIVTGGGRGLGEQISRVLAEAGATVVVGDIRTELAQKVVDDICAPGAAGRGRPARRDRRRQRRSSASPRLSRSTASWTSS